MIAAHKLKKLRSHFLFWWTTQELIPAKYLNYMPRPRSHAVCSSSKQYDWHTGTQKPRSEYFLIQFTRSSNTAWRRSILHLNVCVFVLERITEAHTWSCEGCWLSWLRCPDCSSRCPPSQHAVEMETQAEG